MNKRTEGKSVTILIIVVSMILIGGAQLNYLSKNKNKVGDSNNTSKENEISNNENQDGALFNFLNFEQEVDPRDNKVISKNLSYSHWSIVSGERMAFVYNDGPLTSTGAAHREHFKHNDQDTMIWSYNNEYDDPPKQFYYEIDEEKLSINMWYAAGDKVDPAQQDPHVVLSIIDYSEDSMTFTSETFWFSNIQFIKDGTYTASRIDFNLEEKERVKERDNEVKSNYK